MINNGLRLKLVNMTILLSLSSTGVVLEMFIALAILSAVTIKILVVKREDLKPYFKSEKRPDL